MTETVIAEQLLAVAGTGQRRLIAGSAGLVSRLAGAFAPADAAVWHPPLERGVVAHHPDDLVVTVHAGTRLVELDDVLARAGQECPIDSGVTTTVGGAVASGLAPGRMLAVGRVRDWVLGARIVTGDGALADVGSRTTKDVTGYDLTRLLCGSWGSLAVLVRVHLRTRPRPRSSQWFSTSLPLERWRGEVFTPAAVVRHGSTWFVQVESGRVSQAPFPGTGLRPSGPPPAVPDAVRISVAPGDVPDVVSALHEWGLDPVAHWETGLVLVADPGGTRSAEIRRATTAAGGTLLRLDGISGQVLPSKRRQVERRLKHAFDPSQVLASFGIEGDHACSTSET